MKKKIKKVIKKKVATKVKYSSATVDRAGKLTTTATGSTQYVQVEPVDAKQLAIDNLLSRMADLEGNYNALQLQVGLLRSQLNSINSQPCRCPTPPTNPTPFNKQWWMPYSIICNNEGTKGQAPTVTIY